MTSKLVSGKAKPLANYPHAKRAGDFIHVSGTSARRPDNSVAGVETREDGIKVYDVAAQTEAVIANIADILAAMGAGLGDLVEMNCFLVDMADYQAFNSAYNRHFDAASGPARTTVAVRQLPHPDLKVEIRAVAWKPL